MTAYGSSISRVLQFLSFQIRHSYFPGASFDIQMPSKVGYRRSTAERVHRKAAQAPSRAECQPDDNQTNAKESILHVFPHAVHEHPPLMTMALPTITCKDN